MAGDMLGKRLLPRLGLVVFVVVGIFVTSELRLSSIRQRLLAFAPRFDRVSCDYGGLLPPVHQDDPRSVPRRSSQAHPACTSMRARSFMGVFPCAQRLSCREPLGRRSRPCGLRALDHSLRLENYLPTVAPS